MEIQKIECTKEEAMQYIMLHEAKSYDRNIQLSKCKILWREYFLTVEYRGEVFTREYRGSHLLDALELMNLTKPRKWKTIGRLMTLRQALRENFVNGLGVGKIFEGKELTLKLYNEFVLAVRAYDYRHHGCHTF